MNGFILLHVFCFVVSVLMSYEACNSKGYDKLYSIFFIASAIVNLMLLFTHIEMIK